MILGRLIGRFLLVPLGAGFAILAAVLFVIAAHWNKFSAMVAADGGSDEFIVALFFVGSWIVMISAISASAMLLPAMLGALIAEAFAIRSWVYHVANGALSAWIGLYAFDDMRKPADFYGEPLIVVGAGIVAGFAYWLVAGWSAGFWRPVFEPPAAPPPQPAQ